MAHAVGKNNAVNYQIPRTLLTVEQSAVYYDNDRPLNIGSGYSVSGANFAFFLKIRVRNTIPSPGVGNRGKMRVQAYYADSTAWEDVANATSEQPLSIFVTGTAPTASGWYVVHGDGILRKLASAMVDTVNDEPDADQCHARLSNVTTSRTRQIFPVPSGKTPQQIRFGYLDD